VEHQAPPTPSRGPAKVAAARLGASAAQSSASRPPAGRRPNRSTLRRSLDLHVLSERLRREGVRDRRSVDGEDLLRASDTHAVPPLLRMGGDEGTNSILTTATLAHTPASARRRAGWRWGPAPNQVCWRTAVAAVSERPLIWRITGASLHVGTTGRRGLSGGSGPGLSRAGVAVGLRATTAMIRPNEHGVQAASVERQCRSTRWEAPRRTRPGCRDRERGQWPQHGPGVGRTDS
jgi:FAD/FMN-containing dehydrogenase